MKVGVIGAGAWGTALGTIVARGGTDVVLWSYDGAKKEFDGVASPDNLYVTKNMADMGECDTWLVVTPSAFFRETVRNAAQYYSGQPIVICTKGAEPTTGEFMSEIMATELPTARDLAVLSDHNSRPRLHVASRLVQHWPHAA